MYEQRHFLSIQERLLKQMACDEWASDALLTQDKPKAQLGRYSVIRAAIRLIML